MFLVKGSIRLCPIFVFREILKVMIQIHDIACMVWYISHFQLPVTLQNSSLILLIKNRKSIYFLLLLSVFFALFIIDVINLFFAFGILTSGC